MKFVLITLYIISSSLLILVIMLQPGKGSGMGALGGGSSTVFGARGAVGFLGKLTGWLAAAFMVLALILARMSLDSSSVNPEARSTAPATPGAGGDEAAGDEEASDDEKVDEAKDEDAPAVVDKPTTDEPKEEAPAPDDEAAAPTVAPKAPAAAEPAPGEQPAEGSE